MKLIKSITNEHLYYTRYKAHQCKETEISVNFLGGSKTTMNVFLSLNRSTIGKFDLLNNKDVKQAYNDFCSSFGNADEYFKTEKQFTDVILGLAVKLRTCDYELETESKNIELTEQIRKMLSEGSFLNHVDMIIRTSSRKGFVREWDNLAIAFLTMVSAKTDNPVNLDLTGPTSVGKSYIVIRATMGFNKDFIDVIIGGSKTSYKYQGQLGEDGKFHVDLYNKSIIILESSEAEELIQTFKAIMSHDAEDDMFEIPVTGTNEMTGEKEVKWIVFHGIPSFIMLGTTTSDQDEYHSRTLKAAPEISPNKIKESVDIGFEKWGKPEEHVVHPRLEILKDSMSWIRKYSTINIFASVLSVIFPKDSMIRNRDRDKLIGLIESMTIAHQLQRLKYKDSLMVSFEDNVIALMLMDTMMDTTMASLPKTAMKIYETMQEMENPLPGGTRLILEEALILERIEAQGNTAVKSLTALGEHLDRLLNHHLIEVKTSGRGGSIKSYKIVKKEDLNRIKLAPLFIEKVAGKLDTIMEGYEAILEGCTVPEVELPQKILKNDCSDVEKYVLGTNYFTKDNISSPIYYITPKNLRDKLFNYDEHILEVIGDESTVKHMKRKAMKEKVNKDIKSGVYFEADYVVPTDDDMEVDPEYEAWEEEEAKKYEEEEDYY